MIPLNGSLPFGRERPPLEEAIREIVRNVRFEFSERGYGIRLLGADMYYHALDPHLPAALARFDPPLTLDDVPGYRAPGDPFDLFFEDSWSGWAIAGHLRGHPPDEDLVIIHLDDHTDMMSTLLEFSDEGGLIEPSTGQPFDPENPADWEIALASGSIGIGSFITPFFHGRRRTHIRHLNNTIALASRHAVTRKPCGYELIPGKRFAAIELAEVNAAGNAGSYVGSSDCDEILESLPGGRVAVHVDLDYFINDFNGNARSGRYVPPSSLIEAARRKADDFFDALDRHQVKADNWVVATSPGFCSACHWEWLLDTIKGRIPKAAHPSP